MDNKKVNKAIIYDGWYDSAKCLEKKDKNLAYDYLMAILETQFYGERKEEKKDPVLEALMVGVDFSLLKREEKMAGASIGGQNTPHNRSFPYALIYQLKEYHGLDNKKICDIVGCGERTVSNAVKGAKKELENGFEIEALMQSEQQDEKYEAAYAKYFSFLQSNLL